MDTLQAIATHSIIDAEKVHALLLQWLLNPQSSNFTQAQTQNIDWYELQQYYCLPENLSRLQILVDYLSQNDYQQLRTHALLPLLHHRILPMLLTIIHAPKNPTSINLTIVATQEAELYAQVQLLLLQLLTKQTALMQMYFNNSPKALVNIHRLIRRWEKESIALATYTAVIPVLFEITLRVYLGLPRKPAYRFAALELKTLLLGLFPLVQSMLDKHVTPPLALCHFMVYFKTQAERQVLLDLIENRECPGLLLNAWSDSKHGMPNPKADKPCITRKRHGLIRLWS